ncbi:MAG: transcriptional regulator NrdR [Candidatus Micrarchaeota archaeon]|nr:transcriptional regulator NrdR [Candidatus Micrarchaeota archaeon]
MKCPYCYQSDTEVVDSRDTGDFKIRRRRECLKCGRRFTTYEEIEKEDIFVIKKDGRREKFDRHKLITGIQKACEKRPVPLDKINEIADKIESRIRKENSLEVKSSRIGELVMDYLKKIDKVAYVRFASVYLSFSDIESFETVLKSLKKKK